MSRTDEYINELYEAGLVDRFGNRLYPDLHHHGDRQPVQGWAGTRINPSDVLGNERYARERSKIVNEMPVALQYTGRAYFNHPGWKKYYKRVIVDLGAEKDAPVEDGEKVQRYLTNNGYRRMYLKRGKGSAVDFTEIWMHERYVGAGGQPGDFEAESLAQLREYIAMAVAKRDEDTVEPETEDVPTSQPESNFDHAVDVLANFVGGLATSMILAGYAA